MITIRRTTDSGLATVERAVQGCWIDAVADGDDEPSALAAELGVPVDFVRDALDRDQVALIEKEDGAVLVLVRIPHLEDAQASVPYVTLPLGIVVTGDSVVTVCRIGHQLLRELPPERASDLDPGKSVRFVLHLLWAIANRYLRLLREIENTVEGLEERLQRSLQNREVLELLRYQKSLVHFTTSLRGNELILQRLRQNGLLKMERKEADLLEDVVTEHRQAIQMVETSSTILSNMMDAFASIISNNLNVVMKFLTSITVVLIIPTVIGTFWGMNVRVPMESSPLAFLTFVGLSVVCSLTVALVFRRKGWL